MYKSFFVLAVTALLITSCTESTALTQTPNIRGKFAPPPGQTLLIIGQDIGAVQGYTAKVEDSPGGVTTYTGLSVRQIEQNVLQGLTERVNYGSGDVFAQQLIDENPNAVLAIGLSIVDDTGVNLKSLGSGAYDKYIDRLGNFILATQRPVFLRIGYEFDGEWNHYDPALYVGAYRRIVTRLRENGVKNFASVWQSATFEGHTYRNLPFMNWYPGDEYVDWLGLSYFVYTDKSHLPFLDFAHEHNKPVLIAEASPRGYDLGALTYGNPNGRGSPLTYQSAEQIWQEWYVPFFAYIHQHQDVIRAVAYINVNWNSQPMWKPGGSQGYWGDSRIEANPLIRERWLAEVDTPFWLHGSPQLFALLSDK